MALGLSSWIEESAHRARRVGDADPVRRSRRQIALACHLQWYLAETAEIIAHGLSQAFQKRGLPRSALSDNGAAMTAAEITQGLTRLGILHQTTLPHSPYQNAKQEAFWGPVEEDLRWPIQLELLKLEGRQIWLLRKARPADPACPLSNPSKPKRRTMSSREPGRRKRGMIRSRAR